MLTFKQFLLKEEITDVKVHPVKSGRETYKNGSSVMHHHYQAHDQEGRHFANIRVSEHGGKQTGYASIGVQSVKHPDFPNAKESPSGPIQHVGPKIVKKAFRQIRDLHSHIHSFVDFHRQTGAKAGTDHVTLFPGHGKPR